MSEAAIAHAGRGWPAADYEVGREKIREYANAVGETAALHHDRDAARAAGFRDVVAPPMFAVVYSSAAIAPAIVDPEVGIDFARMLHGSQEFVWSEPVCAGDTITTAATLESVFEKGDKWFYVFATSSTNQDDQEVVRGTWTNIVRSAQAG